jgi:DNA-binding beta-propeller fold protein YncE
MQTTKYILGLATFLLHSALFYAEEPPTLVLKSSVPLPGVEGRFDHASLDAKTHRLFFAALGNNTVEVVDVLASKRLHTITGLKKPTGVLFLKESNILVVANGDDGTCRFYDGTTYAERGRVNGLEDADNVRFDAKAKRVYVGYGEGALGVIDPEAMALVATIPLPKHPESFQLEENGTRIYVNVPEAKQIAVVDRATRKTVATWPVETAQANFPMALDEKQHCLFVGCRQPARLLALDTETGKVAAEAPMGGDVDDVFFDRASGIVLASCGEGFIDKFRFHSPAQLERLKRTMSAPGARTSYFSAEAGSLFLAVPHRKEQGAEIRIYGQQTSR